MPQIRLLPPSVVNKIAAGEVIERPASVAKELIENALDAGATRIDVAVGQGGSEYLRVVDNGCGMAPDQLPLALTAHATSKLVDADDLFRVGTLGFRGEALASIAEVSRLILRSRAADLEAGAEIEVVGGQADAVAPCGAPPGTTIEVHNLFFNTPVRRKFLKGVSTELGHVTEAFTRLALAHPHIHFTLRHNDRAVHDLPPVEQWSERIGALCGADIAAQLIPVSSRDGDIQLSGYAAAPNCSRGNARLQFLFLNGRPIRDRSLQHALGEAYRGLLLTGRYPICFLKLELPYDQVDVNVHPTKMEVRFLDAGRLYSQLLGTLRTKFLTTDLTHPLQVPGGSTSDEIVHDEARAAQLRQELVDWAKGALGAQRQLAPERSDYAAPAAARSAGPLELTPLAPSAFGVPRPHGWPSAPSPLESAPADGFPWERPATSNAPRESSSFAAEPSYSEAALAAAPFARELAGASLAGANFAGALHGRPLQAMQIHDRYVIAESEEGVLVIDQHALHERILYEQFRAKASSGELETQNLLVPEPVDLSPAEAAAVLSKQDLLARIGLRVEGFGGSTILITGYPAMLTHSNPREILLGLLEQLMAGEKTPERRDVLDELLHMLSCKAAIKAGDKLTPEEITSLVAQRHLAQDTHHCPHGRPTALVFTRAELDKQFMRI
ncbi:MAG TPA: DNA mismatch repair endonuclease MutL [Pirellulales bacterium]|jgi:DNA mismatch repair protein MutL|nr:DNA mismatch repair endonuclease MutL [Pirellulales bacterium]